MVIVGVEPGWQGVASGCFGGVVPGEGPPLGQGAVEAFDLPIVCGR